MSKLRYGNDLVTVRHHTFEEAGQKVVAWLLPPDSLLPFASKTHWKLWIGADYHGEYASLELAEQAILGRMKAAA